MPRVYEKETQQKQQQQQQLWGERDEGEEGENLASTVENKIKMSGSLLGEKFCVKLNLCQFIVDCLSKVLFYAIKKLLARFPNKM